MTGLQRLFLGFSIATCVACRPAVNYSDPVSPRYAGAPGAVEPAPENDTLRIVSFNIRYAQEMAGAARLLKRSPSLRNAHIVFLQEMTAPATRFLAESLGMYFVYYPAIYNRIFQQDVGNAILSRYPMSSDAKLILPARSRYAKTQRIATAATVTVKGRAVRLYSTHFGTPLDLGWEGRVAQLQRILDDASSHDLVVIGGDVNSKDIGQVARQAGYLWPTDTIPASNEFGRLDHFFVRGLELVSPRGAGTQRVSRAISDHNAIWIQVTLP
jgi:endonuclease/exonuclease/phosphatase family metal-dependent hydrolase